MRARGRSSIPCWDTSGKISAVKESSTVPLPADTEELRHRLSLFGTAWFFVKYQQTSCQYLRDFNPQTIVEYGDYFLGKFVLG